LLLLLLLLLLFLLLLLPNHPSRSRRHCMTCSGSCPDEQRISKRLLQSSSCRGSHNLLLHVCGNQPPLICLIFQPAAAPLAAAEVSAA